MDGAERAMLEATVRDAMADPRSRSPDGTDVDEVLSGLGWPEMLEAEPRDAVAVVFTALGETNGVATALDDVLMVALGATPRPDIAVLLPRFGAWDCPGRVSAGEVHATGVTTARIDAATGVLAVCESPTGLQRITVPKALVDATPVRGIDPHARAHVVEIHHVTDELAPVGPTGWESVIAAGRRAVAHQLAGASRTMLALARTHAMERVQFGRPIAGFQAVRHRLADAFVAIEALDATLTAAWDAPGPMTAALAKACAGQATRVVAAHCQQVLAGIGFTTDHPFHGFLKRTMALEGLFGSTDRIVIELGRELLDARTVPTLIEL